MVLERLCKFFERYEPVKWQIVSYFFIIDGYKRMETNYERSYGRLLGGSARQVHHQARTALGLEREFEWRKFPSIWAPFVWLRNFSTAYMIYVVIKYLFSRQVDHLVGVFLDLERPIHCYLMGRYILSEGVAELMGAFFSVTFLLWRYAQSISKPYRYNLIHFLTQSKRDRELVYARVAAGLELGHNDIAAGGPLGVLERFHLDTMCYRVIYARKVVLRLRANRTRDAYDRLRKQIARATCTALAISSPIALTLFTVHMGIHMQDQRYLRVYPNCDPELERMNKAGQIGSWSMTFTGHHLAAVFFDELENLVLWIECGLVATIAPAIAFLYNYDLVLQWSGIRRKFEHLLLLNKLGLRHPRADCPALSHDETYELVAEVSDFFSQLEKASEALNQFIDVTMIGFLSLSAIYTYLLQTNYARQTPASLIAVILFLFAALSLGCYTLLMVHKNCLSSYTTFCSLLAHLEAKRNKINFSLLIEFFAKNRDCCKLMGLYPFLPTTFLTIIGWSFSCICVITGVLRQGELHHRLRTFSGLNTSFVS